MRRDGELLDRGAEARRPRQAGAGRPGRRRRWWTSLRLGLCSAAAFDA
jgi:hypothetical protein